MQNRMQLQMFHLALQSTGKYNDKLECPKTVRASVLFKKTFLQYSKGIGNVCEHNPALTSKSNILPSA